MASETQSELDFEVALNASISQKRIYDEIGYVLWEKLLTVSSQMTNFSVFRWQNWVILLNAIITVLNSFFLVLLSLKFKALLLLVCSQKAKADLVFTVSPKATVATKTAAEAVHELWQLIQTGVSEFVGNEIMLVIICLILLAFFSMYLYNAKRSCSSYQTRVSLDILATNFHFERTVAYLKYSSDYYRFIVNFKGLEINRFWRFGCVKLQNCLQITSRLTTLNENLSIKLYVAPWQIKALENVLVNTHHVLATIYDRDQHLTDPTSQINAIQRSQTGRDTTRSYRQNIYPSLH